jgi:hypothetical protein
VLRRACHLWDRERSQRAKQNCPLPVDTSPAVVRLTKSSWLPYEETAARPVNLPVRQHRPPNPSPTVECRSSPGDGQINRPSGRVLSPHSGRLRRS